MSSAYIPSWEMMTSGMSFLKIKNKVNLRIELSRRPALI